MIRSVRGRVLEKRNGEIVVEVAGFGLGIDCDLETLEGAEIGREVFLHTSFVFGEEPKIYGFSSDVKRNVFEKLMRVSKVGPKTALRILSTYDVESVIAMIKSGDYAALARVPGVGKKTAERIVLELKKEFEGFEVEGISGFSEAIEALQALGYSAREASEAVKRVAKKGMKVEDLIREALRSLKR